MVVALSFSIEMMRNDVWQIHYESEENNDYGTSIGLKLSKKMAVVCRSFATASISFLVTPPTKFKSKTATKTR